MPSVEQPRDTVRARLIEVAAQLLASDGPDAVTTRAVAAAAGVQAPTIYRLFGDKDGLLDAVLEHGVTQWVGAKQRRRPDPDPVRDLRAGWEMSIGFALANPALAALMYDPRRAAHSPALEAGRAVLRERIARLAAAGRLAVAERRALELIAAAGSGVVLTLLAQPADQRDPGLADAAYRAVTAQILSGADDAAGPVDPAVRAAVHLRAALPQDASLSPSERQLLLEWLDRISGAGSIQRLPSGR